MRASPVAAAGLIAMVTACSAGGAGDSDAAHLTILASASLRDALERARTVYQDVSPGTTLTIATDSAAALRAQIEQGAPADLFLSADTEHPHALTAAGLTDGGLVEFARNELVVVVPADNPGSVATPADLARRGTTIVAAGPEVPITRWSAELVEKLAGLPGYPSDFAARYAANVVSREDNVRGVLVKVELGEADAGIVYATDARASDQVIPVAIPAAARVTATYAGVVVAATGRPVAAHAFLDWLAGPGGQAVLAESGFVGAP